MKIKIRLLFFLFFYLCGFAYADFAADKAKGLSLVQSGKYREAFDLYLDLLRENPEDFEVNLMLARSAKMAGKLNHSRMAYERVIEALPHEAGLRVEYADLLVLLEHPDKAMKELSEAKRLDPSLDSSRFGDLARSVEQKTSTLSFNGKISAGVLYDSNMNNGPDSRGINIGGIPVELSNRSTAKETFGTFLHAGLNTAWRATPGTDWWLVGDASGYQRWNFETSPRRDLTYGRGALGLRHLTGRHLVEVRAKGETLLENESTSVNIYGGEFNSVFVMNNNWQNIARFGVEYRDDHVVDDRSGVYWFISEHFRYFYGEAAHSFTFGGKYYSNNTDASMFDYRGFEASGYFTFNLPEDFILSTGLAWRKERYDGPAVLLENKDRDDDMWRVSLFLNKKITENIHVDAGWQFSNAHSNSDLYDYDQHLVLTSISYSF